MCGCHWFTIKVGWEPSEMVIHSCSQSFCQSFSELSIIIHSFIHSVSRLLGLWLSHSEVEYTYSKVYKSSLMNFYTHSGITTIWIKI